MKSLTSSLKFKINFFILLLMFGSFVIFSFNFIISEKNSLSKEINNNGIMFANFSTKTIYNNFVNYYTHNTEEDFNNFKSNIESILTNNKDIVSVYLLGINGRILFDSEELENGKYEGDSRSIKDEELINIVKKDSISSRELEINNEKFTEIISPVDENGGHIFSVRYLLSHKSLSDRMKEVYTQISLIVIPIFIIASIFTIFFVSLLIKPIDKLTSAVNKIQAGNLDVKTDIKSKDEIGKLGFAFNEMTTKLKESYSILEEKVKERTEELEKERGSLEEKVKERTKNLDTKIEELEKMNNLMVDREMKMIELKKELEKYKTDNI